jgi:hypothetical protein
MPGRPPRIMTPQEAAALIKSGDQVGWSGFTGSGYPKTIAPPYLRGEFPRTEASVFTGAWIEPEREGALAIVGGIHLRRLPQKSDPETRKRINAERNGIPPPQPSRPICRVWIPGEIGCGAHGSDRGAGGWMANSEFVAGSTSICVLEDASARSKPDR